MKPAIRNPIIRVLLAALAAAAIVWLLAAGGCGVKGPPRPPLPAPNAGADGGARD